MGVARPNHKPNVAANVKSAKVDKLFIDIPKETTMRSIFAQTNATMLFAIPAAARNRSRLLSGPKRNWMRPTQGCGAQDTSLRS